MTFFPSGPIERTLLKFNSWLNSRHPRIQFTCIYSRHFGKFPWHHHQTKGWFFTNRTFHQTYFLPELSPKKLKPPHPCVPSHTIQGISQKMQELHYPRPLLRHHSGSFYPTRIRPCLPTEGTSTSPPKFWYPTGYPITWWFPGNATHLQHLIKMTSQ